MSSEPVFVEISDGPTQTIWRFDEAFLRSNWSCIWDRGCKGIRESDTTDDQQGCCSLGAELDEQEALNVSALAATIDPTRFQHHRQAAEGVLSSDSGPDAGWRTRVVDDACIFLNRPGFEGSVGCALHLEATSAGESAMDWKPSVCWQLPLHLDWVPAPDGFEVASVRAWSRSDWGTHGETMAWCCTEEPEAYVGEAPVIDTLAEELEAMVGDSVMASLRQELAARGRDIDNDLRIERDKRRPQE